MTTREAQVDAIASGLGHPLRRELLERIEATAKPTSPNELAKALGEPLTNVSYHMRQLDEKGLIRLTDTEQRRGALEHYYQPTALGQSTLAVAEFTQGMLTRRGEVADVLRSMRAIVSYDWSTEQRDYEQLSSESEEPVGHVFEHLQRVDEYLKARGY